MKIDRFTKIVLTVIALNLSFITLKELDVLPQAHAEDKPLFSNQQYGLVPVNDDGSITVRFSEYDRVDVNLVDINTADKLNVHIKSSDSYSLKNSGPVEITTD